MPSAGQSVVVVVCSVTPPGGASGQVGGPFEFAACPSGQQAYSVQAYLPFSSSQSYFDALATPFDQGVAGGIFGFAFGLVVFFYLLGLKGSVILRPFWGGRY